GDEGGGAAVDAAGGEHRQVHAVAQHHDTEHHAQQAAVQHHPDADRDEQADGYGENDFHVQASRSSRRNSMCSTAPSTVRNTPTSNSSGVPSGRPAGKIQLPVRKASPCTSPITPAPAATANPTASSATGVTRST